MMEKDYRYLVGMALEEGLRILAESTDEKDTICHIGAKSGFFFVGKHDNFIRDVDGIEKSMIESNGKDKTIPIRERTIKEAYPRTQEDGIVMVVEGGELGKYADIYGYTGERRPRLHWQKFDEEGCQNLANEIVRDAAKEYSAAYLTSRRTTNRQDRQAALNQMQSIEHFFYSDYFRALTSIEPSGLIRKLKELA